MRAVFLCFLCLCASYGCTSTKQYAGPDRPPEQLAVLVIGKGSPASIKQFDGKSRGLGMPHRFEFLPGTHVLGVIFIGHSKSKIIPTQLPFMYPLQTRWYAGGPLYYDEDPITLSFQAEAGHQYELMAGADYSLDRWTAWIVDSSTGKLFPPDSPGSK